MIQFIASIFIICILVIKIMVITDKLLVAVVSYYCFYLELSKNRLLWELS